MKIAAVLISMVVFFNSPAFAGQMTVTASSLIVRDAPAGNRVGGLFSGQSVAVQEINGEWARVIYNERAGWVSREFLRKKGAPRVYTYVRATALIVRSAPAGDRIDRLPGGARVRVHDREGAWSRISAGPIRGWVSSGYLADSPVLHQENFENVIAARLAKQEIVDALLSEIPAPRRILLVGYKEEETLELWAKSEGDGRLTLIRPYAFCSSSGTLGPKRKSGDFQIPEGFYHIDRFKPDSDFFLSLGLNYPNRSDRVLSDRDHPGGAIFIHGGCASIGCIPITHDKIKALYLIALQVRSEGQEKIPVYIFPCRMDTFQCLKRLKNIGTSGNIGNLAFWNNLKTGHDIFETRHDFLTVSTDSNGTYTFR